MGDERHGDIPRDGSATGSEAPMVITPRALVRLARQLAGAALEAGRAAAARRAGRRRGSA
jgi:hypothetical protein